MTDWQPIETAPKDGTWFLACCRDGIVPRLVRWADRYDRLPIGNDHAVWSSLPTHWLPIPDTPHNTSKEPNFMVRPSRTWYSARMIY